MTKKLDWNANYTGAIKRKVNPGQYSSYQEMLTKARERQAQADKARAEFQRIEPALKQSLLEHMVNRKPFKVTRPLSYFAEEMSKGGATSEGRFEVTTRMVPVGTTLTYVGANKTLGTWLFKGSDGSEVEIYSTPVVALGPHQSAQNPGYWGLMTQTSIYDDLLQAIEAVEEK